MLRRDAKYCVSTQQIKIIMKKLFYLLIGATVVFSCGKNATNEKSDVTQLKHERDSLIAVQQDIASRIAGLETRIALLDTTMERRVTLITSKKIEAEKFEHFFEVQASVESDKSVNINAEIPSVVKQIPVTAGQQVAQGQTLVILDTEVIRKNIEEVKTAYDLAKTIFQKQEALWSQKIGSEMQYLEAKNRKESLETRLSALNAQLEKSTVTAPFSGVVDEIFVKQGEVASPMLPLVRLVNLDHIYLKSDVSEDYLGKVKNGTLAIAEFPSLGLTLEGKVNFVGNFINPNNRTFRIHVEIPGSGDVLKPNLLANIRIVDFAKDSAIAVPSEVILQDAQNNEYVFVVDRNGAEKAKKKIVQTGLSYNNKTLVKSGLDAGEEIILEGARNVREGEEVAPVQQK